MGLEGVRAALACARVAARLYPDVANNGDPNLQPTLALCAQVVDGKSRDLRALQVRAYDLSATGLASTKGNGSMLVSASYAAYAVTFAVKAQAASTPLEKARLLVKASSHAADCAINAWAAMAGQGQGLARAAREAVSEEAAIRAWAQASAAS